MTELTVSGCDEETELFSVLWLGLLSGFEEHCGPWLVVVFHGIDGSGYAARNCSKGFLLAAQDIIQGSSP